MVDIVTTLAGFGHALNIAKELSEIDKNFDEATLKLKIAELSKALADGKNALTEAQNEILAKDQQIADLRENFKETAETVEHKGFLYRKKADGSPAGNPYCPRCYRKGSLEMTMRTNEPGWPVKCPICEGIYKATRFAFEGE